MTESRPAASANIPLPSEMSPEDHIRAAIQSLKERSENSIESNRKLIAAAVASDKRISGPEELANHKGNYMKGAIAAIAVGELRKILIMLEEGLPGLPAKY